MENNEFGNWNGAEAGGGQAAERSRFPSETPVGMTYVPWQQLQNIYEPDAGLTQGTIFPELDKPWYGSKAFAGYGGMGQYRSRMSGANRENKGETKDG